MTTRYSMGARNAFNDSGLAAMDGSTTRIAIYEGSLPATGDTAISGTLLATLDPSDDMFPASSGGVATANAITSDSQADAAGHPGFGVIYRTDDTALGSSAGTSDRRVLFTCGVRTLLNGAIDTAVTTIPVDSTLGFPASGTIVIDSERITYTGTTATTFTGCTRGTGGTSAASHSDNAVVSEADVEATFDNANFGGSGATAGFVLNAQVSMSAMTFTWPASV